MHITVCAVKPQTVDREVEQGGEKDESPEEDGDGRMQPVMERRGMARVERDES